MKRTLLTLVFAVTALVFASCGKDDENTSGSQSGPTPEIPTTYDLARTSWVGVYEGTVVHPQAGTVPCILTWTLDFVDETNVSIMLEMVTGGQAQQPQEMSCTYTLDGCNGEIVYVEEGETQTDPFVVDPVNRTLTVDFRMVTGFSRERPQQVGGVTVFHQIR